MDNISRGLITNSNISHNPFLCDPEDNDYTSTTTTPSSTTTIHINASDSPPSKITSPKKSSSSRRAVQKRVVSIPIKEVEGSRHKGESTSTPPSDSWAWRKYGQKPIKGSPYPRGYYRCSSSKGCPARKQVERSRLDPTMLVVTYSAEHNHPWPASRNNNHHHLHHQNQSSSAVVKLVKEEAPANQPDPEPESDERFAGLGDESLIGSDEFGWFGDMERSSSPVLVSPIFAESSGGGGGVASGDVAMVFPMREEDESLFADLGELPECSLVFGHRGVGSQVEIC